MRPGRKSKIEKGVIPQEALGTSTRPFGKACAVVMAVRGLLPCCWIGTSCGYVVNEDEMPIVLFTW